jgi:hypothetical protein
MKNHIPALLLLIRHYYGSSELQVVGGADHAAQEAIRQK